MSATGEVERLFDAIDLRMDAILERAGELHVERCRHQGMEVRNPPGLARHKAKQLLEDPSAILSAVVARDDLDVDAAAAALLDGIEPPRRGDPIFLPGTGWVR